MLEGAPPGAARELLRARLEPLGESARQVLAAAAVIGREFDFEGVRAASGRSDEEAVTALEELATQGIVHELAGPAASYDFSHEKLRALVYEDTSPARRRLLHRRVADALSARGRVGPQAALAARHYQLGGRDDEAAQQHRRAAEHAIRLHAHADALAHLEGRWRSAIPTRRSCTSGSPISAHCSATTRARWPATNWPPPPARALRWRPSSISSAPSTSAAANGGAPRRTSAPRSRQHPPLSARSALASRPI